MGKHEAGTPKAIAKQIKAKGLQRLRWYCQFCQKQCRDENGLKIEIVSTNTNMFIDNYSKEFEADFLKLVSRRVAANQVYNEFIKDRNHIHMNSTQWASLSEFVKHLGRESKCVVEETPKGWFMTFINRDPDFIARKEAEAKKEKMELTEEDRQRIDIENRLKEMQKFGDNNETSSVSKPSELSHEELSKAQLSINLSMTKTQVSNKSVFGEATTSSFKKSALDEIMENERKRNELKNNSNHESDNNESWITKDVVVKIMDKKLADGQYYKQKGVIIDVVSDFVAKVKMIEEGLVIKIDQTYLETVIPAIGCQVKILRGRNRGVIAKLVDIDIDSFSGDVEVDTPSSSSSRGSMAFISNVPYEDFSKYQG
eukprot:gene13001-15292_t